MAGRIVLQHAEHLVAVPLVERTRLAIERIEIHVESSLSRRLGLSGLKQTGAQASTAMRRRNPEQLNEQPLPNPAPR